MKITRVSFLITLALLATAPNASATGVFYLPPMRGPIIRHFEPPPTPYSAGHRGIDIAAPIGTPVRAAADGVVHFAGQVGGQLFVSVDHADGVRTTYSFLSRVSVRSGAHVGQGDVLGLSGAGHAGVTPSHLHFGAIKQGIYIDPEPLLVAGLRREPWRVIHLAPPEAPAPPRGSSG